MFDGELRTAVVAVVSAVVFALARIDVIALLFSIVALAASIAALLGQHRLHAEVLHKQEAQDEEVAGMAERRAMIEGQLEEARADCDGDGDGA